MEFGAIPPHDSGPSKNKAPQGTSKIEKDLHDLNGLTPPRGSREARRILHLLESPNESNLGEAREILYGTESRPVLTFVGDRLAKLLSPHHVCFAVDLLKRKSLLSTDAFLRGLVTREHKAIRHGLASPLAGPDMAPLRVAIAKLCVDPELFFSEKTRERHQRDIEKLLLFPIVLLRRSASDEVASVLVKGATVGGIESDRNRRALEALSHLEEAHPRRRVVSPEGAAAIVATMGSFLRDPFNRMDAYSFVDRWLRKPSMGSTEDTTRMVREALFAHWEEYRTCGDSAGEICAVNGMDVVALLNHFKDPASRTILERASNDWNKGVAILARLCVNGPTESTLNDVRDTVLRSPSLREQLQAIRVFSYSISIEHELALRPIFSEVVAERFTEVPEEAEPSSAVNSARAALLSVMARRLFMHPVRSPFTAEVLSGAVSQSPGEVNLVASTLMAIARQERIMPLRFYDEPELLRPVGICIELLRHQAKRDNHAIAPIADAIEGHFILDGPARFGFQLTRTRD